MSRSSLPVVLFARLFFIIAGVSTFTLGRPTVSLRSPVLNPFKFSSTPASLNVVSDSSVEKGGDAPLPTSIFNLAKSIIGAGVLSLPNGVAIFANDPKALIPASIICAVFGLAAAYTFSSIGKVCKETESKSFMEAWNKLVDPKSGWIISTSITMMCFLASLAYSIIIGDSFTSLAQTFNLPALVSSRPNVILLLSGLVLFPLCAMKSLSALAPFSLLGLGGTLYTAIFMLIRLLDRSYFPGGRFFDDIVLKPSFGKGFTINQLTFVLLSMLSTSYIAHYNAPKFYTELKNNTMQRFNTLVGSAFGTSILFFIFVMVTGFLQFGGNTSGFILNNYSSKDTMATLARFAIGLALLTGYPFTFSALREGLLDLQGKVGAAREKSFFPLTVGLLGLVTGLALVLKDVGFVVSMTGALLGSLLMLIVPAIMNISSHKAMVRKGLTPTFGKNLEVTLNYGLAGTGVVMTVLGVYVSVMRQMGKL